MDVSTAIYSAHIQKPSTGQFWQPNTTAPVRYWKPDWPSQGNKETTMKKKAETITAKDALAKIDASPASPEIRDARGLQIRESIHQGDVYLTKVSDKHPKGKLMGTRQVAVGETPGSKHIATGSKVEVFEGKELPPDFKNPEWLRGGDPKTIFLGPLVVAKGPMVLTHPNHAHHALDRGTYQVTFQADAKARQRVQD